MLTARLGSLVDLRTLPTVSPVERARLAGARYLIGVDEVGYGAWAGPLVVAGVVTPIDWTLLGVTDSKKISSNKRERLYPQILNNISYSVVHDRTAGYIDRVGMGKVIVEATCYVVVRCLRVFPDAAVMLDGNPGPVDEWLKRHYPKTPVITEPKADSKVLAVGAASIVAKVERDAMMCWLEERFPGYDFEGNKGYHSAKHVEGLQNLGPCVEHRRSYKPIKAYLERHGHS